MYISKKQIKIIWITTLLSLKNKLSYDVIENICKYINYVKLPDNFNIKIEFSYLPNTYIDLFGLSVSFPNIYTDNIINIKDKNSIDKIHYEIQSCPTLKPKFNNFVNNKNYVILYETNNLLTTKFSPIDSYISNTILINITKQLLLTKFNDNINDLLDYIVSKLNVIYYIYVNDNCEYIIEKPFIIDGIHCCKPDGSYITNIKYEDEDYIYISMKLLYLIVNKNNISIV